jgi:stress response protein YsnF
MQLGFHPQDISVVTRATEQAASERLRLSALDAADAGRVAASGPIAATLAKRDLGLVGTLQQAGVAQTLAEHYANAVRRGETLESVLVEDRDAERVADIMRRYAARTTEGDGGGVAPRAEPRTEPRTEMKNEPRTEKRTEPRTEMKNEPTTERARGAPVERAQEERYIPVMREEMRIGKREVERGTVRVEVRVVEQPVAEHITLREERIHIERRPADRAPRPEETQFRAGHLDMVERDEEPVVSKQVRVVEEIRLQKRITERDEVINDKVRSTDVDIDDRAGDRKAYRARFDAIGGRSNFDEALPAFELGRNLRGASASQRWEDIEENARLRWEEKRPGTWDKYKDDIRYAWSRARGRER